MEQQVKLLQPLVLQVRPPQPIQLEFLQKLVMNIQLRVVELVLEQIELVHLVEQ